MSTYSQPKHRLLLVVAERRRGVGVAVEGRRVAVHPLVDLGVGVGLDQFVAVSVDVGGRRRGAGLDEADLGDGGGYQGGGNGGGDVAFEGGGSGEGGGGVHGRLNVRRLNGQRSVAVRSLGQGSGRVHGGGVGSSRRQLAEGSSVGSGGGVLGQGRGVGGGRGVAVAVGGGNSLQYTVDRLVDGLGMIGGIEQSKAVLSDTERLRERARAQLLPGCPSIRS